MKICILTQPLNFNYGGVLQAYALQKVIRQMGHEVVTDRFGAEQKLPFIEKVARFGLHFWKRYICGYKLYNPYRFLFCRLNRGDEYTQICVNIDPFITNNIRCIDLFEGECTPSLQRANEYDTFIVGSDQVWRALYNHLPPYFLSFVQNPNTKRIAYAASFGLDNIDDYNPTIRQKSREWLARFDAISVREESGVNICSKDLGVAAEWVLDPTMLLDVEDYLSLIESRDDQKQEGKLMNYILNESKQKDEIVDFIASKLSLSTLDIVPEGVFNRRTKNLNNSILPSIGEWLSGFRDAEFVVSDSFHGIVFSIIFNTPFVAIDNRGRGSARFTSLLKIFGLENRLISSTSQLNDAHFAPIDWQKVNTTLHAWREKSLHFLSSNLG